MIEYALNIPRYLGALRYLTQHNEKYQDTDIDALEACLTALLEKHGIDAADFMEPEDQPDGENPVVYSTDNTYEEYDRFLRKVVALNGQNTRRRKGAAGKRNPRKAKAKVRDFLAKTESPTADDIDAYAFPWLFPTGRGGYRRKWSTKDKRRGTTMQKYLRQRVNCADHRFSSDPLYMAWAVQAYEHEILTRNMSFCPRDRTSLHRFRVGPNRPDR